MQAIGQLDEHHANVLGHSEEHLAHALRPYRLVIYRATVRRVRLPLHLRKLGYAVNQLGHIGPKSSL